MNGTLTLQNGMTFHGTWETSARLGKGEVVFFTGMTGYQEVLTDPSYVGQVIVFTYPLIGQYGLEAGASESVDIQVAGVIVQTLTGNGQSNELKDWLEQAGIPVLSGIDTRTLVHTLREEGDQWGLLAMNSNGQVEGDFLQITETVTTAKPVQLGTNQKGHIVCLDFGVKSSMVEAMLARGYGVTTVPYDTPAEAIHRLKPDGVLVSNGPGDPRDLMDRIETVREVALRYPTLGICMGHQLIALSFGAAIEKQTYGHRGSNHPVRNVQTGEVWMTSQNHGYVVTRDSLERTPLELLFENVNDLSVEGTTHPTAPILTAQFHPEASPGPKEAQALFDQFDEMIQQGVNVYA